MTWWMWILAWFGCTLLCIVLSTIITMIDGIKLSTREYHSWCINSILPDVRGCWLRLHSYRKVGGPFALLFALSGLIFVIFEDRSNIKKGNTILPKQSVEQEENKPENYYPLGVEK